MAALPFIFLTNELHVVSSATLQNSQPPPTNQITKHFFKSHVEDIKKEFMEVKAMGSATAEEWLKGLEDHGKERKADAARWERYESTGAVERMRHLEPLEIWSNGLIQSSPRNLSAQDSASSASLSMVGSTGLQGPNAAHQTAYLPDQGSQIPQFAQHIHDSFRKCSRSYSVILRLHGFLHWKPSLIRATTANGQPQRFDSPSQNVFPAHTTRPIPPSRHERTKEEVADLKAARRAEIERRCLLLEPPISANVLAHMSSFQAAIQIIQPLNDGAWEVLKPRLQAQREEAEQRERDRLAQTRVIQERFDDRYQGMQVNPEVDDPEIVWEEIQAPLRVRVGGYADEIIRDGWSGGDKVTEDSSPRFAADVLIYVRKRFYAEVAKDEAALRATGREPQSEPLNGPWTRKLVLENMKWVFDTKIKPFTERYRKELFLCNGFGCESNTKFYGFEGVIQHYAAKHTNALSSGSIVVHWRAEWPEEPPFNPDPTAIVAAPFYKTEPNANPYLKTELNANNTYATSGPPVQQIYGYGLYQTAPAPISVPPNPHAYQESPGPYYGNTQYTEQYNGHQNGPYAPPPQPQVFPGTSQSYQGPQYSAAPVSNIVPSYEAPYDYSQQSFGGHFQGPNATYTSPHPGPMYSAPVSDQNGHQQHQQAYPQNTQFDNSYSQQPAYPASHPAEGPPREAPKTEAYKAQLQTVARCAREVWNSISPVKEVPGSVKVYTILYHVLKRSRANYQEDPSLPMIIDGLSNSKDMRPVRNINGLLCRACSLGMAGWTSKVEKKHFSFPQLVNHFHQIHEIGVSQNNLGHVPDWTTDMVDLPDHSRLLSIAHAPGIDDQRLKYLAEALPEIVSTPKQEMEMVKPDDTVQPFAEYSGDGDYKDLAPSRDNHERYYTTVVHGRPSEHPSSPQDDDQYDPRKPQLSGSRDVPPVPQPLYTFSRRAREDALPYLNDQSHYRAADDGGHQVRRDLPVVAYDSHANSSRAYNSLLTSSDKHFEAVNDDATQTNRIYDIVAQISQQAQQARRKRSIKETPIDGGSEDGEVRAEPSPRHEHFQQRPADESNAAERFLNTFLAAETVERGPRIAETTKPATVDATRPSWDVGRAGGSKLTYYPQEEGQQRHREHQAEDDRAVTNFGRAINTVREDVMQDGYVVHERVPQPRQPRGHDYEDHLTVSPEQGPRRERSPELVDRRYKLNNVVYRDERQGSHGLHRTPSRYARYESVRLENDRTHSSSPVYVKVAPQHGQYGERASGALAMQEPIYRTRSPIEDLAYERAPRPGYVRVFADDHRQREPQYAEAYEYVQVSDPRGDYMIRRPVRRETERVYTRYEDEIPARQPVYEARDSRATATRADPAYYEEYDPLHPAPPPTAGVRQVRYQ